MGRIKFEVPHTLSREEAKKRVEALGAYWQQKYGVSVQWAGDNAKMAGKAMGVSIDAELQVLDGRVSGDAIDPGFLLRGQATKYLQRKFADYLDPKRTLEEISRADLA